MIQRVHNSLFQRLIWVIVEFVGMLIVLGLHYFLLHNVSTQITQRLVNHRRYAPPDGFHFNQVIGILLAPFREQHNLHL